MTTMRMRSGNQLGSPDGSGSARIVSTESGSIGAEQGQSFPTDDLRLEDCKDTTEHIHRRKSVVTFDIDSDTDDGETGVTVQSLSGYKDSALRPGLGLVKNISLDRRRMSAPELPPIRNHSGKRSSTSGHSSTNSNNNNTSSVFNYNNRGSLVKNDSSSSLRERRASNTQSPNSQRSSSPSVSNKLCPTSRTSTGSWLVSSDQQSTSTSNVKLETLFEKNVNLSGMTLDSPRTTTSTGVGYDTPKRGKMPGVFKNNNNNSVANRNDKGFFRDQKGQGRGKRASHMHHSSSETQLTSGVRLPSRLGRSSTSSVNNTSFMNISRNSSDQRLKDRSKNLRNSELDDRVKISMTSNKGLASSSLRNATGTVNGMRKYSSTLALNTLNRSGSKEETLPDVDGTRSDDDEASDRRIRDWLIGADDAEPPPDPEITYAEEPPQTDTALHIVYKGD